MKLRKDEQRWLKWIVDNGGSPRGMTLGKGRPHDRRTVQSLIDKRQILTIGICDDPMQAQYAALTPEDENGLALFVCSDGIVWGANYYGCEVRRFSDEDYKRDAEGSAFQNGIDTAWEKYPNDEIRREWIQWAVAQSTLAMRD